MSKSKNLASQTAPTASTIVTPSQKDKLFGLSRDELQMVTGGTGVVIMDPMPAQEEPIIPVIELSQLPPELLFGGK